MIKPLTKEELYDHPGWKSCTFEGAREDHLLRSSKWSLREKVEWLEEAETLSLRMKAFRAAERTK